jgi:hypothetical protein
MAFCVSALWIDFCQNDPEKSAGILFEIEPSYHLNFKDYGNK